MSKATSYPVVLPGTGGQKQNFPEEFLDLAQMVSPYSRNMELYNGRLQGRGGLSKFSSTILPGFPILTKAVLDLTKFGGTRSEVFATKTDILKYDFSNSRFDFLTPLYTTGTIEVQAGTPTIVRGTGTSWTASNVKAGDYIKLGAGSVHTGSTWYIVQSLNVGSQQITLTASAPTTGAGSSYVLRQTFTGGADDFWDWVQFEDTALGQLLIITNGVDKPYYWTGTGQFTVFANLHTGLTAAKYVSVYGGRLIFGWLVLGGLNQPQSIVAYDPYTITVPDEDAFPIAFTDLPTEIKGMTTFGGYHIVFMETNAQVGRFVGGDEIFDYNPSYQCKGARSAWSIVTRNDFMVYYGSDKKFHRWNLLQDDIISEDSFPETVQFDPNQDEFVQGFDVSRRNQIRWFCPYGSTSKHNYVFVYDYQLDVGMPWEYTEDDACCCFGSYLRTTDVFADDPIYGAQYADETGGFADDSDLLDNGEVLIYGGYDGYVRLADSGIMDDGAEFIRLLRIKRLNFDMPDFVKRLEKQQWWFESAISGDVQIKMLLDDSTSYEPTTNTISLIPDSSDRDMVKRNCVWNMRAQDFQPEVSANVHFATLGFINYVHKKQRTNRGV